MHMGGHVPLIFLKQKGIDSQGKLAAKLHRPVAKGNKKKDIFVPKALLLYGVWCICTYIYYPHSSLQ